MSRPKPTLDQIEGRAEPRGADRSALFRDNREPSTRGCAIGSDRCWCGQPRGHDWPGKGDDVTPAAPHPREDANPAERLTS